MAEILVPIFGIIFCIGLPISIPIVRMALNYRRRHRMMELHHAERMAAIERGMEIPALPIEVEDPAPRRRRRTSLLPGLVWFFVGIAVLISMGSIEQAEEASMFGLIPTAVGLAYLIYYFVEGRKLELARTQKEDPGNSTPGNGTV